MNDSEPIEAPQGGEQPAGQTTPGPATPPPIDIELLAEKVYALLRADLEVSRVRGERAPAIRWNR
jgi:hypothetical protein